MSLYEVLLIGHILGVVVMAFGSGTAMLASLSAGSRPTVSAVITASRLELLGGRVVSFAAVVVALLGTWLVKEGNFEFSAAWISAAYALWFVSLGIGGGILARHSRKTLAAALAAQERGETTSDALIAQFRAPIAGIGGTVLGLMYVVFVYLMVAKPGM
ncbi:MAG: DUF2269 family protein [Dehalococcoidia bacterium]|nr:DUF2269 family protein [Dehalococcoidia bacterium]MCA9850931.1 DUF2269 family protein [Dehalococcoidia bacterium]MCA9856448.1 DUF2269 family protein [Dehalococcoidia bacterium]MCB9492023.1 DUF2269 family protein [Dehalococcoidia bacterium]